MHNVNNKTVIITGASRGIGAEAARVFAAAGANVALLARNTDEISALATEIGVKARAIRCDVADYAAVVAAVEETQAAFGGIDVLINNAGTIAPIIRLEKADAAEWGQSIDVNIKGVFYGIRAVAPIMIKAGRGTILTVSSGAAHNALEGWSAYCAAKAGAAMLTRSAHLELAGKGIRVMGLSPGTVATDMQVAIRASGINPVSQLDPSVHIPADWPAKALLWMCSDDSNGFLGQELALRDETLRRRVGLIT